MFDVLEKHTINYKGSMSQLPEFIGPAANVMVPDRTSLWTPGFRHSKGKTDTTFVRWF